MAKQTDIVIIGGGAAGLTLAALLERVGMLVCVVDPYPPPALRDVEPSGRTVALMAGSINILWAAGVWDVLAPLCNPMEGMRIIDDSDGSREPIEIEFPASDIGLAQFGYNVPMGHLRSALYEAAQGLQGVRVIKGSFADYVVHDAGIDVRLEDGEVISAALLVGADGRNSAVRRGAGIAAKSKQYDQSAITCVINHSHSHNNISTEFHRENGPMALVPLLGNQSSVVWVERTDKADALLHLKKQEFVQALQDKTCNILGGITLEVGPQAWPLCSIKAADLIAPRVALVAEAAHVMSPITAQGLNLSLRDVAALAEGIVDAARVGVDVGSAGVLGGYAKRRRLDVETRAFGVDAMNRPVSSRALGLKRFRRAGLKSLDMVSPLKGLAMQVGLAPKIDQSRIARGERL